VGRRRFRVREAWEQDGYRVARPEFFGDKPPPPGDAPAALEALAAEVTRLVGQWIEHVRRARAAARRPPLAVLAHLALTVQAHLRGRASSAGRRLDDKSTALAPCMAYVFAPHTP